LPITAAQSTEDILRGLSFPDHVHHDAARPGRCEDGGNGGAARPGRRRGCRTQDPFSPKDSSWRESAWRLGSAARWRWDASSHRCFTA
jgi:hypothetical protein